MAFGSSTDFTVNMKLSDNVSGGLGKIGDNFKKMGAKISQTGKKMTMGLTLPIAGLAAVSLKAAVDFESAFAGVIKTTDGLADNMGNLTDIGEDMKQGFRDLAKEVPIAFDELAAIGELGGQLGIAREKLIDFTRVIAAMGVATNLTTEEAATGFAQIANVMGTPQEKIENMGSSIVELGNNFATTESDILGFAQRIAGAGKIAGLTEDQVFGISAAFSSVGIEAAAGGTAVQKVLMAMTSAVAGGGAELATFAEAAGMTGEEFAKAFEEDAAGAFEAFVSNLGEQGDAAIGTLEDLGLQDQRLIRAFLSLAGAGDLLADTLESSEGAWEDNTALTKEAESRYGTTASQLEIMKNTFTDLAATIGDELLPIVQDILNELKPFIDRFTELDPKVIKVGLAIAGVVAVAGPLLLVMGTLITVGGTLMSVVFSPLGLIIGGIALALLGLKLAYDNNLGGFKDFIDNILANLPTLEDLQAMFENVKETIGNLIAIFQDAGPASIEMNEALAGIFGQDIADKITLIVEKIQEFGEWIGVLVENFNPLVEAIQDFGLFSEEAGGIIETVFGGKVTEAIQGFGDTFILIWEKIQEVFETAIEIIQPALEELWAGIQSGIETVAPIIERFKKLWEALGPFMAVIAGLIGTVIATVIGIVISLFAGIARAIEPFIVMIGGVIDGVVQVITGIIEVITGVLETIWGLITGNQELITSGAEKFKKGLIDIWEGLWNAISSFVSGMIETVVGFVSGFYDSIVKWFTDLYNKIVGQSIIGDLVDGVVNAITDMATDAVKKVEEFVGDFIEWVQELYDDAIEIAKDFIEIGSEIVAGIRKGISDAWQGFLDWVWIQIEKIPKAVRDLLGIGSASKVFKRIGYNIVGGLKEGIEEKMFEIIAVGHGIVHGLEKGIEEASPKLYGVLRELANELVFTLDTYRDRFSMAGLKLAGMIASGFADGTINVVETVKGLVINITQELADALAEMGINLDFALDKIKEFWEGAGGIYGGYDFPFGPPGAGNTPQPPTPPSGIGMPPYGGNPPPGAPDANGYWENQGGGPNDWKWIPKTGGPPPSGGDPRDPYTPVSEDPNWKEPYAGQTFNIYPTYGTYTPELTLSEDIKLLQILNR